MTRGDARAALGLALAGAVAASAGDLALLWVAWAADGRFGLDAPPAATLVTGHYLGVFGIPLYALGYRALADGLRAPAPTVARWVLGLGVTGAIVGAVIHGLTGILTAVAIRTGAPTAPDALGAIPEAAYLMPLWLIVGAALAIGSVIFAAAVARGGTRFPRAMAACNPLLVALALAAAASPFPVAAGFVIPAAPNLAHIVVFAAARFVGCRDAG
jgi:hypothetical protein